MNKALQREYLHIAKDYAFIKSHGIIGRHKVGKRINKIFNNARFGDRAVAQVASKLNVGVSILYAYRILYVSLSESAIHTIVDTCNSRGFAITWSHLRTILEISSQSERERLIQTLIDRRPTVRALSELAYANRGGRKQTRAKRGISFTRDNDTFIISLPFKTQNITLNTAEAIRLRDSLNNFLDQPRQSSMSFFPQVTA